MRLNLTRSKPYRPGAGYDIARSGWLRRPPGPEGELDDAQIEVPIESPFVAQMRDAPGGPYVVAPDSADWVPPDTLAVADAKKVEEHSLRRGEERASSSTSEVPELQRAFLEGLEDPAADRLLEVLERGVEATTAPLDEAVARRSRRRLLPRRL
jgi:hypothetical protein